MLVAQIILSWLVAGVVCAGIGRLLQRSFRLLRPEESGHHLESAWVGWAATLAFLQAWHCFLPVDERASLTLLLLGTLGWVWIRPAGTELRPTLSSVVQGVAVVLLAALIAIRATGPVENYDTGLYHLDSVRWAERFAAVPGLANLHGRLGFNSAHFLYGALCDQAPWTGQGHHLANGFIILLVLATCLAAVGRLLTQHSTVPVRDLFLALSFVPAFELILGNNVTSYSPDLPVFALSIVLLAEALRHLPGATAPDPQRALLLALFFFTGITLKLNFVLVGLPVVLVGLALALAPAPNRRVIKPVACLAALLGALWLGPWLARGVITSGYLAYPVTLTALPVEWRTPEPTALIEGMVVKTWAQEPGTFWANVGAFPDWFPGWAARTTHEFRLLTGIAAGTFGLWLVMLPGARPAAPRRWQAAFLATALGALASWFLIAPDPRFAGAAWYNLTALCGAFVLGTLVGKADGRIGQVVALGAIVGWAAALGLTSRSAGVWTSFRTQFADLPVPAFTTRRTESGLELMVPQDTIQTWGAQPMATHLFRPDLSLRDPARLESGFKVTRPLMYLDGVGQHASADLAVPAGMAARFLDGWGGREPGGTRWMQFPGRFLLFADRATELELSVRTGWIALEGQSLEKSSVTCYVNDVRRGVLAVERDRTTSLRLPVRHGFNLITFTPGPDGAAEIVFRRIKDHHPDGNLAFQAVSLSDPRGLP